MSAADENVFSLQRRDSPLLISVPHDGRVIPPAILERMTPAGRAMPDTDWHVAELYDFAADIGASLIVANMNRYVVDLNRSADDAPLYAGQVATGLCPQHTFAGDDIYLHDGVTAAERKHRVDYYWRPYHDSIRVTLDSIHEQHNVALLWDAHSIPSRVPRLFDGELPQLNLGSNGSQSCVAEREAAVAEAAIDSPYSAVVNQRFKGGYITRHYGDPAVGIHALQLEIAQRSYMDEDSLRLDPHKLSMLRDTLKKMLNAYQAVGRK